MTYKVPVNPADMQWLMEQVETRCKDKEAANILRSHGRFDLEIIIVVAWRDRDAITPEFLVDMTRAMRTRTGLLAPIIYLDGYEPRSVSEWQPY